LTALHKKKEQKSNAPDIVMSGEACRATSDRPDRLSWSAMFSTGVDHIFRAWPGNG
jgi:hypothetical protein